MAWDTDEGGAAFPMTRTDTDGRHDVMTPGMSLRDWFAGQALGAYCAHTTLDSSKQDVADWAYGMADAMIAARKK